MRFGHQHFQREDLHSHLVVVLHIVRCGVTGRDVLVLHLHVSSRPVPLCAPPPGADDRSGQAGAVPEREAEASGAFP